MVDWTAVDGVIAGARSLSALSAHRLHLLAADRLRRSGVQVPQHLRAEEMLIAARDLAVPLVLSQARESYDGRMLIMKGPAIAAFYPEPALRPYWDLDLLVDDAPHAHRALRARGFVEVGEPVYYDDIHHLRPLVHPGLPLSIELHHRPKWLDGREPPTSDELFAASVPAPSLDGILAPAPEHHAVLLAVHAWAHEPLRRLGDLVDVRATGADRSAARAVAAAWSCEGVWAATDDAAAALLEHGRRPAPVRLWARHLSDARERSVIETHLTRWMSPWWSVSRGRSRATVRAVTRDLLPRAGEGWRTKLARAQRAAVRLRMPKTAYDETLPFHEREPLLAAERSGQATQQQEERA